ncbi:34483_t:CDS:2 [Gigaspora margarita]|uniref:34483_t:CDS:1 n=1 Tax=Gigaspora margarita TaxID=4874 RepID=A0ABN7UUD3_GIGMA|nr:34483_t:CDS:2 [Gigaspora margarita]
MLYLDLTGNATVSSNAICHEIEERLRLMLTLADPNIIFNLQTNNRFKGTKFNTFWDETEAYFNEQWVCLIAADNKHKIPIEEDVAVSTESELKESIAGVQEILNNYTERLQLKNNKFKCYTLASKEDITEIFESIFRIDPTLKIEKTTQTQIRHHLELVKLIDTYCQVHAYSFQIKKYNNFSYLYCKPIRLLSQEFDNLSLLQIQFLRKQVYSTKTTEEHRPTYIQSQTKSDNKALTNDELYDYQQALESYSYSCSAPIFPDDHYLCEAIFVCTQINCDSLIEILYYSSRKEGNYSICYYCENSDNLVTPSRSLKEHFKQIYPLCEFCQKNKKHFHTKKLLKLIRNK